MDFRTTCEESKTGVCLLQDGNQEPFKVRLHLARDLLMLQEQDVLCVSGEPFYSGERTVTIRRQTVGGFGLSIKGGAEHNIPVVISKISKEQRAELSGLLFIGDAILQINGINVRKCRHEEVVQVLRNAGEEVTLTVSFLKRAPAFLKLPLNEDCACAPSDQSSGTSSPLCDSGLHLNYHPNNTDTLSCSSWPTSPGLRWEKRWCDLRLIPLLHARFSQYLPGTDLSRQNAFQVVAVDGVCSGIIQCLSTEDCMDWLQAIAANISSLTKHNIKKINRNFPVNQQIVYMGWCEAREQESLQDRVYTPVFLALRGSCLYRFPSPPVTTWDWTRAEKTFSICEIMCKVLKDSDLLDRRKHCFTMQSECGEDFYFSVELESDLAQWERAFQTATFLEVERIQCKTYACVLESHLMGLTIDFSSGFICYDAATKGITYFQDKTWKTKLELTWKPPPKGEPLIPTEGIMQCKFPREKNRQLSFSSMKPINQNTNPNRNYSMVQERVAILWRYKFSQLKGSSDDGKSKIKFLFQNSETKQIEAKELEFSNLFAVLHCIHSFFAAKVACLDPLFLGNQAAASATATSASTSKAKHVA